MRTRKALKAKKGKRKRQPRLRIYTGMLVTARD
jgi:hypothetical protein